MAPPPSDQALTCDRDSVRGPEVPRQLGVARVVRADDEEAQPIRPGLEPACGRRGDAEGVERVQLDQLVVDADPARPLEDDDDLLRSAVAVAERLAHARAQALEADAGARRAERTA